MSTPLDKIYPLYSFVSAVSLKYCFHIKYSGSEQDGQNIFCFKEEYIKPLTAGSRIKRFEI